MIHELDSSELIASWYEFHQSQNNGTLLTLELSFLARLAKKLEAKCPSVVVDIDKYSIESFRCQCSKGIEVSSKVINLNLEVSGLDSLLRQYKPKQSYYESIFEILVNDEAL